jgi:Protein of unknown function (DUF3800)
MNAEDSQDLPLFALSADRSTKLKEPAIVSQEVGRNYGKYIVYVDESGDHGMLSIDEQYPVFVLAFCVFHKRHYSEKVVPALEMFKFKHFGHDQIILHEHEIRKETGVFRIFPTKAHKQRFLDELTSIIEKDNFILISCVIEKRRLKEQQSTPSNPYHIALRYCLETLHQFLEEKGESEKFTHVVVEQRGPKENNELELEFRRICDGLNTQEQAFPFEVLFADKKAMSSGLQLADLVARPIGLHVLRPSQTNRAFEVLMPKFFCAGGREKVGENYEEWGLKIFPPHKSERPR